MLLEAQSWLKGDILSMTDKHNQRCATFCELTTNQMLMMGQLFNVSQFIFCFYVW